MSSLLPIFVSVQSGPHAIDGSVATAGSSTPVNKDPSTSSGQAFTPAFSQVLHEYNETSLIETSPEEPLPSTNDSSLGLPATVIASFDGLQSPVRTLFQGSGFQQTGGDSTLGPVRQESEISGKNLGIAQIPIPKTLEAGSILYQGSLAKVVESELIPPENPQGSVIKQASLGVKQEEALPVRPVVPSAKDVPSGFQQVGRSVLGNEPIQNPILPKVSSPVARPQHVQSTHIPPPTAIQVEGPAGFTGPNLTNHISVKSIPGNSSILSDVSGSVR